MTSQATKGTVLYEGKAKIVYSVPGNEQILWVEFKNSLTAFNAQKRGSFASKGQINARITSLIYRLLKTKNIATHWVADLSEHEMLCQKLTMIPLEVVVRNKLAGSTAKKFGWDEGTPLSKPLVEFYYKNDALGDPFVSDDQALVLKAARSQAELDELKTQALKINSHLQTIFRASGIELIDFKLEFGRTSDGKLTLGDEISPDTCRLWEMKSGERLDKDRFRRDLGRVEESYQQVWTLLQSTWENQL